ncbi:MAG: hypothetical protein LUG61_11225 [Lachnospiraceae bacterium]|nr:hypothetical protein [Lachnospiraceae bacterium]
MKDYTNDSPVFSETISIIETTDKAHADNVNASIKQLHDNTLAMKGLIMPSGFIALSVNASDNGLDATIYQEEDS